MSASANDKITQSMNGGSPVVTTVASSRSIGGTSLSAVALTNWPTATRVFFTTYKKKTDGTKDFSTVVSWWAIASGTTLGTLTRVGGAADAGNDFGDYIEMGPTAGWAEGIYEFGTKEHATDGTHDATKVAMLAGTQTFTGAKTFSNITVQDGAITPDKWSNSYMFRALRTTSQTLTSHGAYNKINLNSEDYDIGNNFDTATNFRFVAPVTGVYHFDGLANVSTDSGNIYGLALFKNGSSVSSGGSQIPSNAFAYNFGLSDSIKLTATDYIELYILNGSGVDKTLNSASLSGYLISKTS